MNSRTPVTIEIGPDLAAVDAALETVPDRPAVFLIWPREGQPYLARTGVLRRRLKRLLGERATPSRFLNLRHIAVRVEYWLAGSRLEASLLHYELARQHLPESYAKAVKLRMPPYVKVLLGSPFPRTQITTRITGGRGLYYGPFRTRAAAEQFESQALDLFQVRRCEEDLEPSPDHPGCIYGEMNKCLRPCQQAVGVEEYQAEAARLVSFLVTAGRSLVEPLEAARDRLSEEMRFEDAAREHKQIERIQEVLRLRDELAQDIDALYGVAVTPCIEQGAVELWFVAAGCWHGPVRFGFELIEGKTVSIDHRLRELVAGLEPERCTAQLRQEHLALLARWFYSTWRDGEWLGCTGFEHLPYRRLVKAISRLAAPANAGETAPSP